MVSGVDGDAARASGEAIGGRGMALDVTDSAAVDAALEQAVSELGSLVVEWTNREAPPDDGSAVTEETLTRLGE